jgi:DNA invertase Pin-like site-specific DNA recombinase
MARRFGYSRVSTSDQDWSLQLEALTKAGVDVGTHVAVLR